MVNRADKSLWVGGRRGCAEGLVGQDESPGRLFFYKVSQCGLEHFNDLQILRSCFGLRSCTLLLGLRSSWFEVLYFAKTFNSFETEKQDGRCKFVYAPIGISSFVFEST